MSEIRNKSGGGLEIRDVPVQKMHQTDWRNPINCDAPTEPHQKKGLLQHLQR